MPYSPRGIYVGLSQSQLNELRTSAIARINSGERTAMSGGQKSGSKAWQLSPQDSLAEVIFAEQQSGARTGRTSKVYQTMNDQFSHE